MYTSTVGAHVTSCLTVLFVECAHGFVPSDTINLYGPFSRNTELSYILLRSTLYLFPSMNFNCSGTITDIRMRMEFNSQVPTNSFMQQEVVVYFLLFHGGLDSPTRRVTHILLDKTNTQQKFPSQIWTNSDPLSLPVTEGSFIGLAIPGNRSLTKYTRSINLLPTSETVETYFYHYQLAVPFSEFEGRVLEAARTVVSSQFTPRMLAPPLIDVSVSE